MVQYGGSRNETSVRAAFQTLLSAWAEASTDGLRLVTELAYKAPGRKNAVIPDGTVRDSLQQSRGYWESKDQNDTLDEEIAKKLAKGYPRDNIIFEDSKTAVLMQHGQEIQRVDMDDAPALTRLLQGFFAFVPPEVIEFRHAIEVFRAGLLQLLEVLRRALQDAEVGTNFRQERTAFVKLGQTTMNPAFSDADAGEMLIQHILTGEIFRSVFDNAQYFEENNIAQQLEKLADTFYVKQVKRDVETLTKPYYGAIKAAASKIADHHEKQKFLKVLYENFYRAYNPAAADTLGIFYTPGEIVRFMIEAADALLERHFQKSLADKGVEILDPATGTGTFITELIDYLPRNKLEYKYEHELHCNELALLPYYIANLNIEATYEQKMGHYREFKNIVLVDTLDNTGFGISGESDSLFGNLSAENLERVKRQNGRPVTVIIGNPPYRANQANENDNNKNRKYPKVDKRIKDTYIAHSKAQKAKTLDMFSRFLRWSTDRLQEEGIIAFIINRSFIDKRTFDGFRKVAAEEYSHIYIVDLGGDVRDNPKLSGPKHNVFAIQTGVAIAFLIKQKTDKSTKAKAANIDYARRPEMETAREKLSWLASTKFETVDFERIRPDAKHIWINQTDKESDWKDFLPVADKQEKVNGDLFSAKTIFWRYSLGVASNRDEWAFGLTQEELKNKIRFFIKIYEDNRKGWQKSKKDEVMGEFVNRKIKWTSELEAALNKNVPLEFLPERIRISSYRPFYKEYIYFSRGIIHRVYQIDKMFGIKREYKNLVIAISGQGSSKLFQTLATNIIPSLDYLEKTQILPSFWYDNDGNRLDNITLFALKAFRTYYNDASIKREEIFQYAYAVLHHPAYRTKYALNLRQEFPRVPFYEDFRRWAAWGAALLTLHVDFETATPYPLTRNESKPKNETPEALALAQKAKLKADKEAGRITLDGLTTLGGVPDSAWAYKLGNRSALEWVLERHKETTPKDPTIREQFNTYRFADHKERVIDLLARVTTVSVETMRIVMEMPNDTI